ncbi:MAG: aminotransferase class V-fold PLP-dependent enzyme, partial [Planctomycetota bacterium]
MTHDHPHAGRPHPSPLARHFPLDPAVVFLNHGSFGCCPNQVLEKQAEYRDLMEAEPVRFFNQTLYELTDRSREAIARTLGGAPEDFVFVPNATTGVATVIDNLLPTLGPGDELIAAVDEYPACRHIFERAAGRTGATFRTFPISHDRTITPEMLFDTVLAQVSERTRLVLLSHVTSPSALVLPVERLVPALRERGVECLVDGAHAPGSLPVSFRDFDPAYYLWNCHKWFCSPKGVAVMRVRADLRATFRPMVLSNEAHLDRGYGGRSKYSNEFDYVGTDDYTARFAVADAIGAMPRIAAEGGHAGWAGIIAHNHGLVLRGREILADALGVEPRIDPACIAAIATLPLPDVPESHLERLGSRPTIYADALQDALVGRHGVQVPVWRTGSQLGGDRFDGRRYIRISAQL